MTEFAPLIYEIVIWIFLLYSFAILGIYSWIGYYAWGALSKYQYKNLFTDYNIIATNPNAPKFSLIAPAYNEGMTIVENVRSLLSLYYNNFEIIIVNDGSKDDSIQKLIAAYNLEAVSFFVQGNIPTQAIKAVYKSKNPAFKKLVVVDKHNGGKADALNVGINISSGDYIVCIDVDCILEQDSILKLAKPFLEQTTKRVIACGGVIRLANNCTVKDGKITEVKLPNTWLGRSQALEYIRAFILGRMAWSRASGLILISGAFGAFDKEIVLACGGYDKNTVGEDMELVVRMRRYMVENNLPHEVVNIPDPLCWTEVPESKEILVKQRNRWMRGTMETLWKHRKMMFNPKYGKLGTVSLPYWFFFEFLGPIIEYLGYIVFIIFFILGIINWQFFFALFALVIAAGILYSIFAIMVDLMSYQVCTKRSDLPKLVSTAIVEPFYFHPIVVKAGVAGAVDYFKKKHSWGEMTRQGFSKQDKAQPWHIRLKNYLLDNLRSLTYPAVIYLCIYTLLVALEITWFSLKFSDLTENWQIPLILSNLDFAFESVFVLSLLYCVFSLINPITTHKLLIAAYSTILILYCPLFLYFSESKNLLGADAFIYSFSEIKHILETAGMLSLINIASILLLAFVIVLPFYLSYSKIAKKSSLALSFLLIGLFSVIYNSKDNQTEEIASLATSKWNYFFNSNANNWYEDKRNDLPSWMLQSSVKEVFDKDFPFLKIEDTKDFIGPFFNKSSETPNLVLIIVEGLGHAYSSPKGYIGNFTPFLDSLSSKSLYWPNTLSSSGRTFSVLPSILGSLPFMQGGFLDSKPYINHYSLLNILKKNNFTSSFVYGGDANFDNMAPFLSFNGLDNLIDEYSFPKGYKKLPAINESWGYEDQAVFDVLSKEKNNDPYFNIALTLSTHNPFLINNSEKFKKIFDKHINTLKVSEQQKKDILKNEKALISVLNLDNALEEFFEKYKKRNDFENTIFIITGDHAMPEIPFHSKIDRYHVPLLVYSPLLNTSREFKHVVSHFDVAPTLLAFYRNNYNIKTPKEVAWVGNGLDKTQENGHPMMQSKSQLIDYYGGKYHLVDNQLFEISTDLIENLSENRNISQKLKTNLESYKAKNRIVIQRRQLIPDSSYNQFMR